jgi:hypothetical protein
MSKSFGGEKYLPWPRAADRKSGLPDLRAQSFDFG